VNDTVVKSSSLPGTTEAVVDAAPPESAEDPLQAAAPLDLAHHLSEAQSPLKITGQQTIRTADELRKALAEYLDRSLAFVLDLSEVNVCDTAALQLIYALRQSALQRKQCFQITAVSPAITETAAALGLRIEGITAVGPAIAEGDCEVAGIDNGI
jgi:anti-anti-sigma regulatory factor